MIQTISKTALTFKNRPFLYLISVSKKSRRVFFALFYRGIGVLLQFSVNLVIGQLFGARGMGIYHLYSSWMVILSDIASLGLPVLTMRRVAALKQQQSAQQIKLLVNRYLFLAILSCLIIYLPIMLMSSRISDVLLGNSQNHYILIYAVLAAVLFLIIRIVSETLKAMGLTNLGILAESAILPSALIVSLIILCAILSHASLSGGIESLLALHLLSLFFALSLLYWWWQKKIQNEIKLEDKAGFLLIKNHQTSHFNQKLFSHNFVKAIFLKQSTWFIWSSMLLNVCFMNLPILVLPHFASTEEIGLFGVAFRLVMLSTTILVSLSALFGPRFVSYYQQKNIKKLKQELHHSQWYSLAAYLPFFIIFTAFPEKILIIFGEEFLAAKNILFILAIAQLINSAAGLAGYFLIMIQHEKMELLSLIITLIITFPIMIVLGNIYGILGITITYAVGITIKNVLSLTLALYFIKQIHLQLLPAATRNGE
ncbi:MAG: hypothetical protein KZQ83_15710 [gamma proteobacterium symbiont of Taylorina sp.]|nr:hypothetical protein [gamma proteobacterium symbiont of Taylorina sp.]